MLSGRTVLAAVFHRIDSLHQTEALGEVTGRGGAQHLGNKGEGMVGLTQEEAALGHPSGDKIAKARH